MNTSTAKAHMEVPQPLRKSRLSNPGWFLVSPSVALLLLWMIVPLGMTLY
ncbi:sugar ABC transporter permease, partial [Pseudomonas mohnii]|nr:sugar ABC transporter permease [Pseudomonas mohnii]